MEDCRDTIVALILSGHPTIGLPETLEAIEREGKEGALCGYCELLNHTGKAGCFVAEGLGLRPRPLLDYFSP